MVVKKDNSNLWRSTKKTPECVKKLEEILRLDGTITEACSYANISRETYYNWLENDLEFSDKMADAGDYAFIEARRTINKAIKEGDWKLALDILRRRDSRYKDKGETNHSGEITLGGILNELWDKSNSLISEKDEGTR